MTKTVSTNKAPLTRGKSRTLVHSAFSDSSIENICQRLLENKQVRRSLPPWGRIHIDRQIPFLCVYRRFTGKECTGTESFVMGQASYLTTSWDPEENRRVRKLLHEVVKTLSGIFGSFLIVELWDSQDREFNSVVPVYKPGFRIVCRDEGAPAHTIEQLESSLRNVVVQKASSDVEIVNARNIERPGMTPLLSRSELSDLHCHVVGVEIRPVYWDTKKGTQFPVVRRILHRGIARSLKRAFFTYTKRHTTHVPPNYLALGRRSMVRAVWKVDRTLSEISNEFDFLLTMTPTNIESAWNKFKRSKFERLPEFMYRRVPIDSSLMKRKLFKIPIERIEDPTLAHLFREQQSEFECKLTMLGDRNTKRVLYQSLQLFGGVDSKLLKLATSTLKQMPFTPNALEDKGGRGREYFVGLVNREIEKYREVFPSIGTKIAIREDIAGVMVSHGNVLIGKHVNLNRSRAKALIAHEVGTHVVTYWNGRAQPFRQMYVGLPRYEELQEGLAVLSEYLVGCLTVPRMRMICGRVIGAHRIIEGVSFVDLFRELRSTFGFKDKAAFSIAARTFRGGGLTKDVVYLKGLVNLLKYFRNGGEIDVLYLGKFGLHYVPFIHELIWRKILRPAPLCPRHLSLPSAIKRLQQLREGLSVMDLVKEAKK